jgi:uncharacterized lipoprotein YddW (UPF0748 family)
MLLSVAVFGQSPKRELRAAWIATVANIDWPSRPGLPSVEQQEEFIHRLDQLQQAGCNAVIVQIRPVSDALYPSSIEPWCHYLTGRQGEAPFPYYDPLKFMIEEAHKRNMEFHAWFNPFRALMDSRKNPNPSTHITYTHPDWIINYGGKSYVDPGVPEARAYVIKVITDVVRRYDIDAVHLDDYFYPYKIAGQEFGDYRSYARYGQGVDKGEWRRDNVNLFISLLNTEIKQIKPYVKLGVSPFGVWRNKSKDVNGSATRAGQTDYDDLYADVLLWMQRGWIDYLMPQLYWEHAHPLASFATLLPWWEAHTYGRHVYYGLGMYRMSPANSALWKRPDEILWQIHDIRTTSAHPGYALYSSSIFDKIGPALMDSLHNRYDKTIALPPPMKWLDSIPPAAPVLRAIPSVDGTLAKWEEKNPSKEPLRYVVYRFVNNDPIDLNNPGKILTVTSASAYLDVDANKYTRCTYVVTALDRLWNESKPSNAETTRADQ